MFLSSRCCCIRLGFELFDLRFEVYDLSFEIGKLLFGSIALVFLVVSLGSLGRVGLLLCRELRRGSTLRRGRLTRAFGSWSAGRLDA